jgi:hypothetical protein
MKEIRTTIADSNSSLPVISEPFPISKERIYLSICDSTVLARPVRASVERFLDQVTYWRESRAVRDFWIIKTVPCDESPDKVSAFIFFLGH